MSLLKDFEHKLESLFEGFFAKSFRSGVHPLELAKKLARHMEEHKMVSVSRVYGPNSYTVYVNPKDKTNLSAFGNALKRELQEFLKKKAQEEGLTILGVPEIEIVSERSLTLGGVKIESKLVGREDAGIFDETIDKEVPVAASLVRLTEPGTVYPLEKDVVTVGRLETNDVTIDDRQVSRMHAEIRRSRRHFVLVDLGSTNGTFVGSKRVRAHTLNNKDILTFGKTEFEFRGK